LRFFFCKSCKNFFFPVETQASPGRSVLRIPKAYGTEQPVGGVGAPVSGMVKKKEKKKI